MALTDSQIAHIVFNETRSLSGLKIEEARINVAHTIANADLARGRRPLTAPASGRIPQEELAIYQQCLQAVVKMRAQRQQGEDPTHGAVNFNFRRNALRGNFQGIPIQTQVGPFSNSYPTRALPATGIYANTYGR